MKMRSFTVGLLLAGLSIGGIAQAANDADSLKKQREELQNKREALFTELNEIRKTIEKTDAVAAAQKALAGAKIVYEAKLIESEKILAAKKAMDAAAAQIKAVTEAELANNPEIVEAQKAVAAADDASFDAGSQLRIAEYVLSEMKRKMARDPQLKTLKANDSAASEAFSAAKQAKKDVEAAKAARDAASKAYDEAIAAKLSASPQGQSQLKIIADLEAKLKESRLALQTLSTKLSEARSKAATSGPKIVEAKKASDDATAAYQEAVSEEAELEKSNVIAAAQKLDELVNAKLDAEPKVAALRKQMDGLRVQIKQVSAQVKAGK